MNVGVLRGGGGGEREGERERERERERGRGRGRERETERETESCRINFKLLPVSTCLSIDDVMLKAQASGEYTGIRTNCR